MLSKSLTLKMHNSSVRVSILTAQEGPVDLPPGGSVSRKAKPTFEVVKGGSSRGAGRGHPSFRADLKHTTTRTGKKGQSDLSQIRLRQGSLCWPEPWFSPTSSLKPTLATGSLL